MPAHRYMEDNNLAAHAGCQEVSRCCTRGEFQGMCNMHASAKCKIRLPTLALKPRGVITNCPTPKGISGPTKRTYFIQKFIKKSVASSVSVHFTMHSPRVNVETSTKGRGLHLFVNSQHSEILIR